jgi:hypothetical protein
MTLIDSTYLIYYQVTPGKAKPITPKSPDPIFLSELSPVLSKTSISGDNDEKADDKNGVLGLLTSLKV